MTTATTSLLEPTIARAALLDSFRKLDPRALLRNPVIFSVWVVSVLVTGQLAVDVIEGHAIAFELQIVIWLWLTVLFANFAEALAEGRGKAQAESLRKTRTTTIARLLGPGDVEEPRPAPDLRSGDRVVCEPGDNELDCDLAAQAQLGCTKHNPHAPTTNQFEQIVVTESAVVDIG